MFGSKAPSNSSGFKLSYNLTRRYPFGTWFEVTVYGVAVLLLAFVSVFNVATIGYGTNTTYTSDPNATMQQGYWFDSLVFTWGDDKLKPKCQAANIAVGSSFMTTNLGLQYTVNSIALHPYSRNQLGTEQRSSMAYLNNRLTNCQVGEIDIDLTKVDNSIPGKNFWWSWAGSSASASASCNVSTTDGMFRVNFSTVYPAIKNNFDFVAVDDPITRASVWWGSRLISAFFTGVQEVLSTGAGPDPVDWTKGVLIWRAGSGKSIKDADIFNVDYWLIGSDGGITNPGNSLNGTAFYNDDTFTASRPLTEGLSFAKAFHSLILADLGDQKLPNLLYDSDLIQYSLKSQDNFNRQPGGALADPDTFDFFRWGAIAPPNTTADNSTGFIPMTTIYDAIEDEMGPLGAQAASILTQYVCTVPERRGIAAVVLLTIIADFALLQAVWTIFRITANLVVTRQSSTAMYCEGCVSQTHELANLDNGGQTKYPPSIASRNSYRSVSTGAPLLDGGRGSYSMAAHRDIY